MNGNKLLGLYIPDLGYHTLYVYSSLIRYSIFVKYAIMAIIYKSKNLKGGLVIAIIDYNNKSIIIITS